MSEKLTYGRELNRITQCGDYDPEVFKKLYKLCTPLIRRLTRNIDCRRLGVSRDIVESMYWDKFLFVFNKYHSTKSYEHLKAELLVGLKNYSFGLMRRAYSKKSTELDQITVSFEDLFDDSKRDIIDERGNDRSQMLERLDEYMRKTLTPNAYIVYQLQLDPPPFILYRVDEESKGKLSILQLIDFFEFPRTRSSYKFFKDIKDLINITLKKAKDNM